MAAAAGVPWSQVIFLRRVYATILQTTARRKAGGLDAEPPDAGGLEIALERALLVVASYLAEEIPREASPEEERREAERIWEALEELPASRRRRLIELSLHAARSWALAERLCEASLRMAAGEPEEALELADLALFIAGQVPGEDGWQYRARSPENSTNGAAFASIASAPSTSPPRRRALAPRPKALGRAAAASGSSSARIAARRAARWAMSSARGGSAGWESWLSSRSRSSRSRFRKRSWRRSPAWASSGAPVSSAKRWPAVSRRLAFRDPLRAQVQVTPDLAVRFLQRLLVVEEEAHRPAFPFWL
jgi:hypothetical protein